MSFTVFLVTETKREKGSRSITRLAPLIPRGRESKVQNFGPNAVRCGAVQCGAWVETL